MASSDMELAKFVFQVVQFILTGLVAFYVYMSNKDKVTNDRIGKLEEEIDGRLDDLAGRTARLEKGAEGAPTHTDLAGIHEKINEVSGSVRELRGEFKQTNNTLNLIHETLMERK